MKNKMFLDSVQLLMIGWAIRAKMLSEMQKTEKGPLSHRKIKCLFFNYINFWWSAERSAQKRLTLTQKNEKGPLSHRKIKCSFLDYIQLLMIGQAIRAKNDDQDAKNEKGPLSHWKIKCLFSITSTSDDWPSNPSKKHWP